MVAGAPEMEAAAARAPFSYQQGYPSLRMSNLEGIKRKSAGEIRGRRNLESRLSLSPASQMRAATVGSPLEEREGLHSSMETLSVSPPLSPLPAHPSSLSFREEVPLDTSTSRRREARREWKRGSLGYAGKRTPLPDYEIPYYFAWDRDRPELSSFLSEPHTPERERGDSEDGERDSSQQRYSSLFLAPEKSFLPSREDMREARREEQRTAQSLSPALRRGSKERERERHRETVMTPTRIRRREGKRRVADLGERRDPTEPSFSPSLFQSPQEPRSFPLYSPTRERDSPHYAPPVAYSHPITSHCCHASPSPALWQGKDLSSFSPTREELRRHKEKLRRGEKEREAMEDHLFPYSHAFLEKESLRHQEKEREEKENMAMDDLFPYFRSYYEKEILGNVSLSVSLSPSLQQQSEWLWWQWYLWWQMYYSAWQQHQPGKGREERKERAKEREEMRERKERPEDKREREDYGHRAEEKRGYQDDEGEKKRETTVDLGEEDEDSDHQERDISESHTSKQ